VDPIVLVPTIRRAVAARDREVPLENVAPLEEIVAGSLSTTRLLSVATGLFAVTALLLSLTGLYAVLSFYVGRRTREIGIRVAFGATGGNVSGMVLKRGMALVGAGLRMAERFAPETVAVVRSKHLAFSRKVTP